ncbi:MAG: hypothetical protein JNJ61_21925, partial [Anaerolineae bacterium]|nr:hypothetical protein [Anaerolineae bacterium]
YYPLLVALAALALVANVWFIWVMLILFFGRMYATPLDMITPLDGRRRVLAVFTLLVFVLIFVPFPLAQQLPAADPVDVPRDAALLLVAAVLARLTRK